MILHYKDVPEKYRPGWKAGVFNLSITVINLYLYTISNSWIPLVCAITSVIGSIAVFLTITHFVKRDMWDALRKVDK